MDIASVRVLVVDDYEPWRRFFSTTVQKRPELQVIGEASDGLEAIQQAQQLQPDLILLDIGLPKLNGIEAARRIRELSPASKILFISENRSPDIVVRALSTGAGGYVVKSDAASELLAALSAVLEGKRFVSASLAVHCLDGASNEHSVDHSDRTEIIAPLQQQGEIRCHEAALYEDDAALVDGFARFVEASLKAGNPVIVIATESHRASVFQRLTRDGVDVSASIEQGMYIPLDVPDTLSTFMVDDLPDAVRFANVVGDLIKGAAKAAKGEHRQVAACGECAPVLMAKGNAEAVIRLEHLWDQIARSYDVDILCGYVSSTFPDKASVPILKRICAEHSAVHGLGS